MNVNTTTVIRVVSSSWRSDMLRIEPFTTFSANVTDGASSVPEAVLMITDSSAPKNTTWIQNGMCLATRFGSTSCESSFISCAVIAGSMIVAV